VSLCSKVNRTILERAFERNYEILNCLLPTLDSPRSRQPRASPVRGWWSRFDVYTVDFCRSTRKRRIRDRGSRKRETKCARFEVFTVRRNIRCKNYIWSICIYMYTQKLHVTHIHIPTRTQNRHVHDTRATRVRVAPVPRARKRTRMYVPLLYHGGRIKCCMLFL